MNNEVKMQYSEMEAAHMLGISVDELRGLVRAHIVKDDETADPAVPSYQKTDLVVLRVLARMIRTPEVSHA
jgi:hypothetical protein